LSPLRGETRYIKVSVITRPMKRLILIVILIIVAGCAEEQDTIKIGVSSPDTGFAASMGEYVHQGIELALERMPKSEKLQIKIIYEDEQSNPTLGYNIARKFVTIDKINFVLGPFSSIIIDPTMDFYEENKVIRMITGLGIGAFVNKGQYKFILLGDVKSLMKSLAKYAYGKGNRKIGVLYIQDPYGQENLNFFKRWFEGFGGEIVAEEGFEAKNLADYKTQLSKLSAKNPDGIFIIALGTHLVTILQQMRELGIDSNIYSVRNTEDTEVLVAAGDTIEGIIFPSITVKSTTEEGKWYEQRYKEKYNALNNCICNQKVQQRC